MELDGAAILDEVEDAVRRYVILPSEDAYVAVVLWIAATYGIDQWDYAPRLCIISPEKRCGKSRLLDVIEYLASKPMTTMNTTVAALVRSIGVKRPPTLLVDEADTIFGSKRSAENNEDLRGLINAGHQRNRYVTRWDQMKRRLEKLPSFAMVALASIRDLPDTIMDRGQVIRMRRKKESESVRPFRHARDGVGVLRPIKAEIERWMDGQTFPVEIPNLPVEDRAADNWEPLIAVADAAGGAWPERARLAAKAMTEEEEGIAQESFGLELLSDIRAVWRPGAVGTHTADLLTALHDLEESPWPTFDAGRPLDSNKLARLLKPYGVFSMQVKVGKANKKGYRLDGKLDNGKATGGLRDAWTRYLPERGDADGGEVAP